MINNIKQILLLIVSFLPFALLVWADTKANLKKEIRNKQFFMPIVALVYCIVLFIFLNKLGNLCVTLLNFIPNLLHKGATALSSGQAPGGVLAIIGSLLEKLALLIEKILLKVNVIYLVLVLFNTLAIILYLVVKKAVLAFFRSTKKNSSQTNKLVSIFYDYDQDTDHWYIKPYFGQARTFLKSAFIVTAALSGLALLFSIYLCKKGLISVPFFPVFSIILVGELAFFLDGLEYSELKDMLSADVDRSVHVTNYVILRKKQAALFGDKLSSDGTTVNDSILTDGSIEQVLREIEDEDGHIGKNYAMFIRQKIKQGLVPDANYIRSGIDLAAGKSLLFNTPFYYKLNPYAFYAMQMALLKGGKVLIVLGRHGVSDDVLEWCGRGLFEVSNVPNLWKIGVLTKESDRFDVGIVTRSGVHDSELHRANREFLQEVSFVVLVEPSRLVTTAQIGLNLLVGNISNSSKTVYCSVDRNCDGLVDALSHILMTNITEVSATEYPQGVSSYMCWLADSEYIHHRLTPGISRFLGMGTEFSFVALKNQVERATWYGGEAFPVKDGHWIAKQYYHDLLRYANLPTTQDTFDKYFKTSYNICNEQVRDNSYVSVEDEFNNLFEVKREMATMSRKQGFVNVISTEYMLREYMTENETIFNADPKAIPYISADFARTKRNIILKICLQMCLQGILKADLQRELLLIHTDTTESRLRDTVWREICRLFSKAAPTEDEPVSTITVQTADGEKVFTKSTVIFKHEYSTETGKFEDFFVINDPIFRHTVLDDLQNARYIAERDSESSYLGTELKGHILQKYLPGQFITLNGKYYEMVTVTSDDQVLVRRASEHINGRLSYRQIRKYHLQRTCDADSMGMLKQVNGILVYNQFADFSVDTPAYWRLGSYNDFENGTYVGLNSVPVRQYYNKQILKLDFSAYREQFTDEIRVTLTTLINEVFRTLFAENQPYIVAVTAGDYEKPLSYSLDGEAVSDNTIYIVEDSQLDIGLLVSVERNLERILQIVSDYLSWNAEEIEKSLPKPPAEDEKNSDADTSDAAAAMADAGNGNNAKTSKKENWFKRLLKKIGGFFKKIFPGKKKKNSDEDVTAPVEAPTDESADSAKSTPDQPDVPNNDSVPEDFQSGDTSEGNVAKLPSEEPAEPSSGEPAEPSSEEPAEPSSDEPAKPSSEESAEPSSDEPGQSEKKKGFFGRLFGGKNKPKKEKRKKAKETEETVSVEETPQNADVSDTPESENEPAAETDASDDTPDAESNEEAEEGGDL